MHNKDHAWVKRNYIKLIKYGMVAYGLITLVLCVFSKTLFGILYGSKYDDSILAFNILMIGFFFSASFKIPTNNIMYSMRKLKINLIVTISSVVLNLISNYILVNKIGMNGAALSTMLIHIFGSVFLLYYARKYILNMKGDVTSNEKNND